MIPRERLTAFSGYPRNTQRVAMWRDSANRDARIRDTYRDYEGMGRTIRGPNDNVNGIYENGIAHVFTFVVFLFRGRGAENAKSKSEKMVRQCALNFVF